MFEACLRLGHLIFYAQPIIGVLHFHNVIKFGALFRFCLAVWVDGFELFEVQPWMNPRFSASYNPIFQIRFLVLTFQVGQRFGVMPKCMERWTDKVGWRD